MTADPLACGPGCGCHDVTPTPPPVITVPLVHAMKADLLDRCAGRLAAHPHIDPVEYLRGVAAGLRTPEGNTTP